MPDADYIKLKKIAALVLETLSLTEYPDIVLEIVCSTLIIKDEQLSNKLHIALANATINLLQHKEKRLDLATNNLRYMISYKKLLKLDSKSKISFLLDFCNTLFPNGKLESASETTKSIFFETINTIKDVLIEDNITSIEQLLEDIWWQRRDKYVKLFIEQNKDLLNL